MAKAEGAAQHPVSAARHHRHPAGTGATSAYGSWLIFQNGSMRCLSGSFNSYERGAVVVVECAWLGGLGYNMIYMRTCKVWRASRNRRRRWWLVRAASND
jgi:hypothetical protein